MPRQDQLQSICDYFHVDPAEMMYSDIKANDIAKAKASVRERLNLPDQPAEEKPADPVRRTAPEFMPEQETAKTNTHEVKPALAEQDMVRIPCYTEGYLINNVTSIFDEPMNDEYTSGWITLPKSMLIDGHTYMAVPIPDDSAWKFGFRLNGMAIIDRTATGYDGCVMAIIQDERLMIRKLAFDPLSNFTWLLPGDDDSRKDMLAGRSDIIGIAVIAINKAA